MRNLLLRALLLSCFVASLSVVRAEAQERTVVIREGHTARFLDEQFALKVLKINGYSIKVKVAESDVRLLKLGEALRPENSDCALVFTEIATETRIARFTTDCL